MASPRAADVSSADSTASGARSARKRGALPLWLLAFAFALVFVLLVREMLARTADTAREPSPSTDNALRSLEAPVAKRPEAAPVTTSATSQHALSQPASTQAFTPMTEAERREAQRRADEAIKVIEDTTPEM